MYWEADMGIVVNLVAGVLFGLGLVISGMADPAKVQNFLDLAGRWDPSLAFVMGGAVLVTTAGYALAFRRSTPVFSDQFHLPTDRMRGLLPVLHCCLLTVDTRFGFQLHGRALLFGG